MKYSIFLGLGLFLLTVTTHGQSYNGPESVVFDATGNRYFISNNGSNQILARDSSGTLTVFTSAISSGPHGLEIVGSTLYACDGASMKGFDLATGSTVMNLNVGATFLNGLCSDGNNFLFATDFTAKKIFKINIASQSYSIFVTGLAKSPNGIIYDSNNQRIIWVTWGTNAPIMQALLSDSTVSQVTSTTLGNCDGFVRDGNGNYYVSAWNTQSIYRFDNLFSTAPVSVASGLSSPADIYYNLADDSLVCPNAGNNTVTFHYMGSATGIPEIENGLFSVYPNPASNQLTISGENRLWDRIEISDMLGNDIIRVHLNSATHFPLSIPLSDLCEGVYLVKLISRNKFTSNRFVVQH